MARYNTIDGAKTGRVLGQLGGVVFTKSGVVRGYRTPTNPQTTAQIAVRAEFAGGTQAWGSLLTNAQREAWDEAAQDSAFNFQDGFTGTGKKYSGKVLWQSRASNALLIGDTLADVQATGPANRPPNLGTVASFTVNQGTGAVVLTFDDGLDGMETKYVVKMSKPLSPGTMKKTALKVVAVSDGEAVNTLTSQYAAIFGSVLGMSGKKVFYTVEAISQGGWNNTVMASGLAVIA